MPTKQEKGAYATSLRTGAERAKIARVVWVLADRNREKDWKWICIEAGQRCNAPYTVIAKMREAVYAFSLLQHVIAKQQVPEAPVVPVDFDLDRYIKEGDETAALAAGPRLTLEIAAALAAGPRKTVEIGAVEAELLRMVPGMRRGRPRRR